MLKKYLKIDVIHVYVVKSVYRKNIYTLFYAARSYITFEIN